MRYRKLSSAGDYTFGQSAASFYKDQPEAVGQAVATRLKLIQGEWFLDVTKGTPYNAKILGTNKMATYDAAIQDVILNTPGVTGITEYSSGVDPNTRAAFVNCTINTIYGTTQLQVPL